MQRCKIDGQSTNNQGVVNEDRISELPEALILQILSLLPTKVLVTTSVLSKQWQPHWKKLPKLRFDSYKDKVEFGNVCMSLLSHKGPLIKSLHLKIRLDRCTEVDIETLLGIAFTRNVRKLVLEVHKSLFRFPRCLYNIDTLETLKLKYMVFMDVPSLVCLKSLRTLHLLDVEFKNNESLLNLSSGCPNLQNLVVRHIVRIVKPFTIAMSSLQRLSIYNCDGEGLDYVINAPSLKYLKIEGFNALKSCMIENVPELVEANIINFSTIIDEKLLGSLTLVKRLSLALSLKLKSLTESIFNELIYLELFTNEKEWWNLLTLMLGKSPKLQILKLIDHTGWRNHIVAREEWNKPKNVPECLLLHLETFIWKGYKWQREEEREVAKYILKNANCLKRVTFSSEYICSEHRLVVVKDLKSVLKATDSCQFQFD